MVISSVETTLIPDEENMFRFIKYGDYDEGEKRIRSSLFFTRGDNYISMNRESIWPLAKHKEIVPERMGICSLQAGEFREEGNADLIHAPLDLDPLLNIPNPSHANASRCLSRKEAQNVAKVASRN